VSIKPIDIQTNIGQMHEVARKEHAQTDAVHHGLHRLDQESDEKASVVNTRLDESREASEMTERLDDREGGGKHKEKKKKGQGQGVGPRKRGIEIVENTNLGRVIDVKK
jgi:hypothetical protein